MRGDDSDDLDISSEGYSLETADAVARAAHIWIRSLWMNELQEEDERRALAGGLVAGLCERLALDPRVRDLVAYVYALLDNDGVQALAVSRMMLERPVPPSHHQAYERGRAEAVGILEMLANHDQKHSSPKTGD